MRSKWLHGILIAVASLMIAVPAYANTATNGGNGGLGNGMGTNKGMQNGISANQGNAGMNVRSNGVQTRSRTTPNYDVSVYGTGTGTQFQNVNANDAGMTNHDRNNRMQTNTNDGYRPLNTNENRGMDWGWLGLLGLIGLTGLFKRDPQRNR